jgi:prevent-host-death family protein
MDVGVRELKAKLSEYLERAERGEVITVTERGRPKAVLAPIPGRDRVEEGIAEGWITPARRTGLPSTPRYRPTRPTLEVLAEDRGS